MSLLRDSDRAAAQAIGEIGYCNPFLERRVALERQALGPEFVEYSPVMHLPPGVDPRGVFANFLTLREKTIRLADAMRQKLLKGAGASDAELQMYERVVLYLLYAKHLSNFDQWAVEQLQTHRATPPARVWKEFLAAFRHYLHLPGRSFPAQDKPEHAFACFFQIQRAFNGIFEYIIGRSMPIARLRADVWRSIFTDDMDRYARALHHCMGKIPTLILGPSGTGKELVAEAISNARYLHFHATKGFAKADNPVLRAVNIAALPPMLIESELFGHCKGAFSGAHKDHQGWLETCGSHGTVFLDEIGDLDVSLQVKLLRVLQTGDFHRVGETQKRTFDGKIIAATNRNLAEAMRQGRFREDLYYRLCADLVQTPTLREQLADSPGDLETHVRFITRRLLKEAPDEADPLARSVVEWIRTHLDQDYSWPGNIRELEQCVRNVMIRGAYVPSPTGDAETRTSARRRFADQVAEASLTFAELTEHYASLAYVTYGTYEAAAEKMGVNFRTLHRKVRPELTELYRKRGGAESE